MPKGLPTKTVIQAPQITQNIIQDTPPNYNIDSPFLEVGDIVTCSICNAIITVQKSINRNGIVFHQTLHPKRVIRWFIAN